MHKKNEEERGVAARHNLARQMNARFGIISERGSGLVPFVPFCGNSDFGT